MDNLRFAGELLAADTDTRTVDYLLLPYGEAGRTSAGTVTVAAGAVTVPNPGDVVLNVEHDRTRPVGRAVTFTDTPAGIRAAFRIAATRAGDDLLAELAEGLRRGVSVELDDVRIRGGRLLAGRLVEAGAVRAPAFPSALAAADTPDPDPELEQLEDEDPADDDTADQPAGDTDPAAPPAGDEHEDEDDMPETTTTAAAPAGLPAARRNDKPATFDEFVTRLTAASEAAQLGDGTLLAALTDTGKPTITHMPDQWVGQLWQGVAQRRVIPLLQTAPLRGLKVAGWRWVAAPAVASWAGDKVAVPSPAATTEAVEVNAARLAGAHDIPREHRDFDTGFIDAYYRAMAASYATLSDNAAAADLLAGATHIGAQAAPLPAIVAGALAVGAYATPAYALLASDMFATLAGIKASDAPAFLDLSLTFDGNGTGGIRVVSVPSFAAGTVVVGAREAATVYELPGSPIRAEAIDMVKGGIDAGVFGYYASVINDARALTVNLAP